MPIWLTWALAIIVLGILGIAITQMKKRTTAKSRKTFLWIGIPMIVLGVISMAGIVPQLSGLNNPIQFQQLAAGTQPDLGQPLEVGPNGCPPGSPDGVTITLAAINKETSVATGGTHRYRINTGAAKTVSDAGTFEASGNDKLSILYGNASTTFAYYGNLKEVIIPCDKSTKEYTAELTQNGSLSTFQVFNQEGNVIDGIGENETLGAGDVVNLRIELSAQNQRGFPYGGILTLELNGSDFDESEIVLSFIDLSVNPTTSPSVHTLSNVANKLISWEIGAFEGAVLHTGIIVLDVDADNDPSDTNDPVLTWRPNNYFINEDTGGSFDGPAVEDEDNIATYDHVSTITIEIN